MMITRVKIGVVCSLLLFSTSAQAARIDYISTVTYSNPLHYDVGDTFEWYITWDEMETGYITVQYDNAPDEDLPLYSHESFKTNATWHTDDDKLTEIITHATNTSFDSPYEYSYYILYTNGTKTFNSVNDNYGFSFNTLSNGYLFNYATAEPGYRHQTRELEFITEVKSYGPEPVPEPTTALLFGAGILGLAGIGRRTRH